MKYDVLLSTVQVIILVLGLFGQSTSEPPRAMAVDADPSFEVATIKPSRPGSSLAIRVTSGRNFIASASSLADLMAFAYQMHARQIVGASAWMENETFDVQAQPDKEGRPSGDQMRSMVQKLLADRFQLVFHREMRDLPVYRIVTSRSGPKLTPSSDSNGRPGVGFGGRRGTMTVKSATMNEFTGFLQRYVLDRPVVDKTNLVGKFDIQLDWRPEDTMQMGQTTQDLPVPPESANLPDLFTAFQQQLGLKLEAAKASVEALVIDRVSRPSAN